MRLKTDLRPITQLKNHTAELVREVSESGRSLVITQNGEAKVVMVDARVYDRWRESMAMLRLLASSQAAVDAGRVMSQDEAFAQAEAAIAAVEADE